jgi:hypothetical protein
VLGKVLSPGGMTFIPVFRAARAVSGRQVLAATGPPARSLTNWIRDCRRESISTYYCILCVKVEKIHVTMNAITHSLPFKRLININGEIRFLSCALSNVSINFCVQECDFVTRRLQLHACAVRMHENVMRASYFVLWVRNVVNAYKILVGKLEGKG